MSKNKFDIVLCGHFSKDTITINNTFREEAGGAVYYCGFPLSCTLKLNVGMITRMSSSDSKYVKLFEDKGIHVYPCHATECSTVTDIVYSDLNNLDNRQLRVTSIASPFMYSDIPSDLETKHFHFATLYKGEINVDIVSKLSKRYKLSMDVQGFIREVKKGGEISLLKKWDEKKEVLKYIDVLKVDIKESEMLTGEKDMYESLRMISSWGCKEILCTSNKGVLVYEKKKDLFYFNEFRVEKEEIKGRTGRGDTTIASYIGYRLKGFGCEESCKFATALCSLKMRKSGAYEGSMEEVIEFMKKNY